ncbi:MAG: prolyl oligopeptidase family serine peptidase [Cyanobacteria bacterium HKST-UBA01]|nr:prolyl oligopeptidase family serine peptidase [Cyanobacteria bacterium HKST-UBA01]
MRLTRLLKFENLKNLKILIWQSGLLFFLLLLLGAVISFICSLDAEARSPKGGLFSRWNEARSGFRFKKGSGSMEQRKLMSGGMERDYLLYLPTDTSKSNPPRALVIACHGGGGNARSMDRLCGGLTALADQKGFIVAFPDGRDRHWNDGRTVNLNNTSDVDFIATMIDALIAEGLVDRSRVYSTGISNGGFFSQYLAKKIPDKLAAVASVAATLPEFYLKMNKTAPVPVLYILGTEDPLVPYNGGEVGGKVLKKKRGVVVPAEDALKYWLNNNEIAQVEPATRHLNGDDRAMTIEIREYSGGDESRDVSFYKIVGGGHTWPQGWQYLPDWIVGKTNREINANQVIWDFFSRHQLKAAGSFK